MSYAKKAAKLFNDGASRLAKQLAEELIHDDEAQPDWWDVSRLEWERDRFEGITVNGKHVLDWMDEQPDEVKREIMRHKCKFCAFEWNYDNFCDTGMYDADLDEITYSYHPPDTFQECPVCGYCQSCEATPELIRAAETIRRDRKIFKLTPEEKLRYERD